ncbi:hypothetical protein D9M68_735660 [compost metagenome]
MAGGAHEHEAVREQRLGQNPRQGLWQGGDAEIHRAAGHRAAHGGGIDIAQIHPHLGILPAHLADDPRQQPRGRGRHGCYLGRAQGAAGVAQHVSHGRVVFGDGPLRVRAHIDAQGRQPDLAFALEQRPAQFGFQLFQGHGQRRWRAADAVARLGQLARIDHGQEHAQVF